MVFCHFLDRKIPGRCASLEFKNDRMVCGDTIYHGRCWEYYWWLLHPLHYKKRYTNTKSKKDRFSIIRYIHGCTTIDRTICCYYSYEWVNSFWIIRIWIHCLYRKCFGTYSRCCSKKFSSLCMGISLYW